MRVNEMQVAEGGPFGVLVTEGKKIPFVPPFFHIFVFSNVVIPGKDCPKLCCLTVRTQKNMI